MDGQQAARPRELLAVANLESVSAAGYSGGIVESRSGEARVSVTVQVDSIDEVCAQVTRLGGRLITERLRVPGYGVHVLCRDPQGCYFALLEPLAGE